MAWTFVYLFVVLKIPVVAALWLVWWAAREPEPEPGIDEGGGGRPRRDHPRPRHPGPRRRGPHGGQHVSAPPRIRTTARAVVRRHQ